MKMAIIALDMLSRLKGIETMTLTDSTETESSLDMLSRLKGIETEHNQDDCGTKSYFGYAFPFEGNRVLAIGCRLSAVSNKRFLISSSPLC